MSQSTFIDALSARAEPSATVLRAAAVLFVATLTATAAQISLPLPFTVVPFTFQPMVVLLGALALGAKLGAASQAVYLAAGIAGLPVFAGNSCTSLMASEPDVTACVAELYFQTSVPTPLMT